MMFSTRPLLAAILLGSAGLPLAQAGIAFTGPEVFKLDWNTRALRAADLNGDGLIDLVTLNNDRSAIEILEQLAPDETAPAAVPIAGSRGSRWDPVLDDARFRKVSVTTGVSMFDLVIGDFDGDGRPDLAYTGDPQALTVRYQRDHGWEEEVLATAPAPVRYLSGLRAVDLNGDGQLDLVQLGQREIAIFRHRPETGMSLVERIPLSEENASSLRAVDVDGNGRLDLVYLASSSRDPLRVRRQTADGGFGPEESFPLKIPRSSPLPVVHPDFPAGRHQFVSVLGGVGQLEFFNLGRGETPARGAGLSPRIFAPRVTARNPALHVIADFDRRHGLDIAVADPDGAQVYLYRRAADGSFANARVFPSLSEIRAASAVTWTAEGPTSLVLASPKEGVFAEMISDGEGGFGPPRILPIAGRPLALVGGHLDGEGKRPVLVTCTLGEESGARRVLTLWHRVEGELVALQTIVPEGLRTDPRDLRLVDINQNGRTDLAVFIPRDGVRFFLQQEDGSFIEATSLPAFRPGLLSRVEAAAVTLGDVDGDGRPELIVAADTYARALRMKADGELEIVAQFNARDSGAEIAVAFILPTADGPPRVVLHDRKSEQFLVLKPNAEGRHEVVETRPVGRIEGVGAEVRLDPRGRAELFIGGRDRFWWVPAEADDIAAPVVGTYASDLPRTHYNYVVPHDLTGDGRSELVAVDSNENLIEILRAEGPGEWSSVLHFKVFEADPHYSGRRGVPQEPRELLLADVTGDGLDDLVLLVHDRILIYPQAAR